LSGEPGADLRTLYVALGRVRSARSTAPPARALRDQLRQSIAFVEGTTLHPVLGAGVAAFDAGTLDTLDARILLDALRPVVEDIRRKAKARGRTSARGYARPRQERSVRAGFRDRR
jgi:hypothetical protein